jgi:hypothetical protein
METDKYKGNFEKVFLFLRHRNIKTFNEKKLKLNLLSSTISHIHLLSVKNWSFTNKFFT